ncbi:MAG: hypothetical protein SGPRY_003543 [Prymnesium sp.]
MAPRASKREEARKDTAADTTSSKTPQPMYGQVSCRTTHIKKKLLVLSSRGITATFVELMDNLIKLLPHAKKEPKFDKSAPVSEIAEIAEDRGCRFALYFEARKRQDLYLWMGATEQGFDSSPQHRVLKQLFTEVFAAPKGHPKSKPFHDHVLQFSWTKGAVLVRHYQIVPPLHDKKKEDDSLVEIGPRFTLTPIKIFAGLFGGETIYSNGSYITPNAMRSSRKRKRGEKTVSHVQQKEARRERINIKNVDKMPHDPLNKSAVFAE